LQNFLNVLGALSIPSFFWNFFLYRKNKKLKEFDVDKQIKLKWVEIDEVEEKHEAEKNELADNYEKDELQYGTSESLADAYDKAEEKMIARHIREREVKNIELDYLQKLGNTKHKFILLDKITILVRGKDSFLEKLLKKLPIKRNKQE